MKIIFKILLAVLIVIGSSHANDVKVFNFSEVELSQLDVRKVKVLTIILFTQLDLIKMETFKSCS